MIDLHCHILPGLDDGAKDWDQSLAMAQMAVDDGITDMVCTPHWVPGKYENSRSEILPCLDCFRDSILAASIKLHLYPGAELRLDLTLPQRIKAGELLTINDGGKYVLIELPDESLPEHLDEFFWGMEMQGMKPIISHVERNAILRQHPNLLFQWVERGYLTQITAASLLDEFSEEIRQFSIQLIEHRLAHMLVSDAHGLKTRKPKLSEARKVIEGIAGAEVARLMTYETPKRVLEGIYIDPPEPLPWRRSTRKRSFFDRLFKTVS